MNTLISDVSSFFFFKCFEILATLERKVQVSCLKNRPLVMSNCVNICFKHHKKVMHDYTIKITSVHSCFRFVPVYFEYSCTRLMSATSPNSDLKKKNRGLKEKLKFESRQEKHCWVRLE